MVSRQGLKPSWWKGRWTVSTQIYSQFHIRTSKAHNRYNWILNNLASIITIPPQHTHSLGEHPLAQQLSITKWKLLVACGYFVPTCNIWTSAAWVLCSLFVLEFRNCFHNYFSYCFIFHDHFLHLHVTHESCFFLYIFPHSLNEISLIETNYVSSVGVSYPSTTKA